MKGSLCGEVHGRHKATLDLLEFSTYPNPGIAGMCIPDSRILSVATYCYFFLSTLDRGGRDERG